MSNSPFARPLSLAPLRAPRVLALASWILGSSLVPHVALAQDEETAQETATEPPPETEAPEATTPQEPDDAEPAPAEPAEAEPAETEAAEPAPSQPAEPAPETTAAPEPAEPAVEEEGAEAQEREAETPPDDEETIMEKFKQTVTFGAGLRTGLDLTFAGDEVDDVRLTLSDGLVDQLNIRPFMSAAFTEHVSAFVQFEIGTANGLGAFAVLDAIAQIKFVDELQLWVGQHIPANDRNNMNGPFFGNGWNFGITVPSYSFDVGARDRGATLWGLLGDGILKYHLSLVDLQPGQALKNSRFGGRLTLNLLEPENYYYASGSYWGGQDTFAIGAVFQYQNGEGALSDPDDPDSEVVDNDFLGFSFDLFFEKTLGSAGTFTFEGGYWNWENVDAAYVTNQGTIDEGLGVVGPLPGSAYMAMLSWLTPEEVGTGKIQVNGRLQYGAYDDQDIVTIDGGLAYVIDGFNHKYHLNYRFQDIDPVGGQPVSAHSIQVGAQYQFSK